MPNYLLVGLGNPEPEYSNTRHNVGFWLVNYLVKHFQISWSNSEKLQVFNTEVKLNSNKAYMIKPCSYMNNSGLPVALFSNYYKIKAENIIVAYDDLDLPCGVVKLKRAGGHGGHNGVRDIIKHIGSQFLRIRFGIDRPSDQKMVTPFVLKPPTATQKKQIESCIERCTEKIDYLLGGKWDEAVRLLHTDAR